MGRGKKERLLRRRQSRAARRREVQQLTGLPSTVKPDDEITIVPGYRWTVAVIVGSEPDPLDLMINPACRRFDRG